jgi:hypothetical protein
MTAGNGQNAACPASMSAAFFSLLPKQFCARAFPLRNHNYPAATGLILGNNNLLVNPLL